MKKYLQLNNEQLKQLSSIAGNLSILFFGSVIAPVFAEIDKVNPLMVVLGVAIGLIFFIESLLLLKGDANES